MEEKEEENNMHPYPPQGLEPDRQLYLETKMDSLPLVPKKRHTTNGTLKMQKLNVNVRTSILSSFVPCTLKDQKLLSP